jgi:CelD/BcsL family acetyltransferase involved in cellulose biosynthesis
VTLEVLSAPEDLGRMEGEWRDLWRRDPHATPFQSPDWLLPWTARLWGGGKLRVLALRDPAGLRALAPFFLWGFGGKPERICLSFLGSGISDYLGMTADPELTGEAAATVLGWIAHCCPEWQVCDLEELREGDPLLRAAAAAGFAVAPCSVCPVAPLDAGFRDSLDARFRRNLRTAKKRLAEAGEVEFVRAAGAGVAEMLDELFRLHALRWEARDEAGMLATAALQAFHREVAVRFERAGLLRLFGLRVNGESIAVQYNFTAKGRVFLYLSGFDPGWNRVSPGAVLLAHSIGDAVAEGARECDFLRKPEAFKYLWGARDRRTWKAAAER